ncbi:MAG: hypothetical protein K2H35_02020, partial [Muribaculaceae bacterium]|nr:hypothetical protein [Muribaculaceae bacterium]
MKHHKIIITLALLLLALPIRSAITGQWVKHPTFDNSTLKVIDTPTRTYFAGYNQIYDPVITVKASPDMTLFYYDKEGDEIVPALRTSSLSGSAIRSLEYNFKKNYLVILYDNYDIDLLYDNGNVVNIPALRYADIPGSKNVNSISFDFANNGIWLATDFGYVILNDEKYEVEDSRNYGVHLNSAVRLLDKVYLSTGTKTYSAPAADRRATLSDYTVLEDYPGVAWMKPVSDRKMVINSPEGGVNYVKYLEALPEDEGFNVLGDHRFDGPVFLSPTKNGLMLVIWGTAVLYDGDRDYVHSQMRPAADSDAGYFITGSWDFKEFFTAVPRLGLRSHKETADGYTLTRDWMRPNAPNAFLSRGMAYHPEYGMLVNSHGVERVFTGTNLNAFNEPILLSALKNGIWTPMAPAYTNPLQTETGYGPLGIAIEPSDSKYVWSGSNFSGITRLNLEDPQDILHYSFANDPTSSLPGYVESAPVMAWGRICQYSAPVFDNNRTLWTCFYNYDNTANVELRYLTEADRKASTGAASARPWRELIIKDVPADQFAVFTPLNSTVNKGLMAYLTQNRIMIYDTNQTPDNTSDDKKSVITSFRDQDGGDVSLYGVNCVYEDPATGNLWFGTSSGIYYIQPRSIMKGQQTINRIKVSRQDGTSQADYL